MACWIKDVDGDLVNLDRCLCIQAIKGKIITHAGPFTEGGSLITYTLFVGTPEECGDFRDRLFKYMIPSLFRYQEILCQTQKTDG